MLSARRVPEISAHANGKMINEPSKCSCSCDLFVWIHANTAAVRCGVEDKQNAEDIMATHPQNSKGRSPLCHPSVPGQALMKAKPVMWPPAKGRDCSALSSGFRSGAEPPLSFSCLRKGWEYDSSSSPSSSRPLLPVSFLA